MDINDSVEIAQLMTKSGVQFGTSGARGLVGAMTDYVCYAYTAAFVQYLELSGQLDGVGRVAIAGDFRSSTPRILSAVARAVEDRGYVHVNCGFIPSPAVALFGIREGIPAIMVTGSHIPDGRNGIKFNKPSGEISKEDEVAIRGQQIEISSAWFDDEGGLRQPYTLCEEDEIAIEQYKDRYLDLFPPNCLRGVRIGLYEHSSVARGVLREVLQGLGAEVIRRGYSDDFIPVDTEAIRPEDVALAKAWAAEEALDSIVSTDGDGDRPLVSDEFGNWLRGDVAGIFCARYLGAQYAVTPVSSNSAVDLCGWFRSVARTRIGSPYVIAEMEDLVRQGGQGVIGYEANGGFLTADALNLKGRTLSPLPTRDAVIVILSVLMLAKDAGMSVSALGALLPARFTYSGRLKDFATEASRQLLNDLAPMEGEEGYVRIERFFGAGFGSAISVDQTDGLRVTFENGEIAHLRPSGNAPELRCYNEAGSQERAMELNRICMGLLEHRRGQ